MTTLPAITLPIDLPDEFIEETAMAITDLVITKVERRFGANELPPYPTRTDIKKVLKIGDERLNEWISNGLPSIRFGKETRFDREDIKQFINSMKKTF
ncbi:helix-turn-helix domain-containing protein [Enterococcus asini]|uniref:helix-turn-helix domain-containing protein n=1 Tax=Enterococcus asini TaxID=57732 RepID=UPI0022E15A71|nr:helix-turn-helix domain-containing protein [Enterococcus asini]